jgi:hypothetical protein
MKNLFPVRGMRLKLKWAACGAMSPDMKPVFGSKHYKTVPLPYMGAYKITPVILNFPVRAL